MASTESNRRVVEADVETFVLAGCNAAEIGAWYGIGTDTAKALVRHANAEIQLLGPPRNLHVKHAVSGVEQGRAG